MDSGALRQRADLTQKQNRRSGRHGWLRLTPAYSVKLVSRILSHYEKPAKVIDPFSGTGTTALAAIEHGHTAAGVDVNPFLVWLGNAKLASYNPSDRKETATAIEKIRTVREFARATPPPIHNIDRWWHPEVVAVLCEIAGRIHAVASGPGRVRDLLHIALCQTIIKLSNAAFNHQSMSFAGKRAELIHTPTECLDCFTENANSVLESLGPNPSGRGKVILGDSRRPPPTGGYDLLITSPPYPNRVSYIRELRPYMYWLGYLKEAKEAGEMDWQAIGGTWGTATSRLAEWSRSPHAQVFLPTELLEVVKRIESANGANGRLLAAYVHKYFCDMWQHFVAVKEGLRRGAKVVYVIGNSVFYGVVVPAERIYAEMLDRIGFVNIAVEPIRKRNSKKELFEYAVEGDYGKPSPVGKTVASFHHHAPTLF